MFSKKKELRDAFSILAEEEFNAKITRILKSNPPALIPLIKEYTDLSPEQISKFETELKNQPDISDVVPDRLTFALNYIRNPLMQVLKFLAASRERANFTYDLTPNNRDYLAFFVSNLTGEKVDVVDGYIAELENDQELKDHIRELTVDSASRFVSDPDARYGRRLGWYAFVRCLKPKVVLETGVDKGLGTCVLAAAVRRNKQEGHEGFVYGTDILESAGFLLGPPYDENARILYGDSITTLKSFEEKIDIYINDSDHSADYERREMEVLRERNFHEDTLLISDNVSMSVGGSNVLYRYAKEHNLEFHHFKEQPMNHFHPGAGIGVARKPRC